METLDVAELVNIDDKLPLTLVEKNDQERRELLERYDLIFLRSLIFHGHI
jgi:hypothetical protein